MAKKSVAKGEKKVKAAKEVKQKKEKKSVFPMPFIPDHVDIGGCQGLAYNRGLFTQCMKKRMENGNFCNGCQSEADKNASGCPDCGTVEQRLATDLYEYKDPKGRSPVSYMKVLGKLKLSPEGAAEEADRLNIEIPTAHLVVKDPKVSETKKNKGRPAKKVGAIEAENVTDLFAKLSAEGDDEVIESDEESKAPKKKAKLTEEEKEAKKKALEEKKKEREAKLAEEKKEREEKRKAELEQKKKEREEKLAEEKKARELKREQEKQEREQKKALEKAEKESKKGTKKAVEPKAVEPKAVEAKVEAKVAAPVIVSEKPKAEEQKTIAPAAEKVKVSRIQIGGKAYLKSSTNILYDPNTKEEVGLWDPETKTIKDLPEDDDDEEEEEYYD